MLTEDGEAGFELLWSAAGSLMVTEDIDNVGELIYVGRGHVENRASSVL